MHLHQDLTGLKSQSDVEKLWLREIPLLHFGLKCQSCLIHRFHVLFLFLKLKKGTRFCGVSTQFPLVLSGHVRDAAVSGIHRPEIG